jgi:hypothetical protein
VTCDPVWWTKKPYCSWRHSDGLGSYYWTKMDCSGFDWPDIYYRDAWIQQKLLPTACVYLGGYSASNAGGLWLENPSPPFTAAAFLPPLFSATWDGALYLDPACP